VHNLRSALDSVAYAMAVRHIGRSLNNDQERASAFPVCGTPQEFDGFFAEPRDSMYGPDERAAFRTTQPFAIPEQAGHPAAYAKVYHWDELRRLNKLSNLDKHRRLAVLGWAPDIMFWPSGGQTNRRWFPGGVRRLIDGAILGYMTGSDPEVGDRVDFQFNLVIEDDPVVVVNDDPTFTGYDAVWMLEGWHRHVRLALWNVIHAL
jgi:hypothetical protein